MDRQLKHPMLPQTTHDELARQNFVQSLKLHIARNISPGNKAIYEKVALPKFEQEHQRSPQNRAEIRQVMQKQPHYCWWSALQRINQVSLCRNRFRHHHQAGGVFVQTVHDATARHVHDFWVVMQ